MMQIDLIYPQFLLTFPKQQHLLVVETHQEILGDFSEKLGGLRVRIRLKIFLGKIDQLTKKLYARFFYI